MLRSLAATCPVLGALNCHRSSLAYAISEHLGNNRDSRLDLVELLAHQIPALAPKCKLSVCIPVAAHEEEKNIRRTIEAFRCQTAPRESWEIVLYLNHPFTDAAGNQFRPDGTIDELNRAIADNPDMHIHYFYLPIPHELATIGRVRRILHDVVAFRCLQRGPAVDDHYMLRADADIHGVSPGLIKTYIERLESSKLLSGVSGSLSHPVCSERTNPALAFGATLSKVLQEYEYEESLRALSCGANLAFRLSAYLNHGGFNVRTTMGEDIEFDRALQQGQLEFKRLLRRLSPSPLVVRLRERLNLLGISVLNEGAEIVVSARRAQTATENGHATIEQWSTSETAFGVDNLDIRRWEDPIVSPGPEVLDNPTLPALLTRELNRTLNFFNDERTVEKHYQLAGAIERKLGLVLEQADLWPVNFDEMGEPPVVRMVIKNMDHVLAMLRKRLFESA